MQTRPLLNRLPILISSLRSENLRLTDESVELKNENGKLKERLDNLSYILADLQGKTKKRRRRKEQFNNYNNAIIS